MADGLGSDEILYHARIHPEQYSNTLQPAQLIQLHKSIHHVTSLAVETLADSSKFPEEWLFKHRWGKGKRDSTNTLPNGAKITFLTVGGRTSAVVPSVQKKTGPVAGDINDGEGAGVAGRGKGRKGKVEVEEDGDEKPAPKKRKREMADYLEDGIEPGRQTPEKKTPAKSPKGTPNGTASRAGKKQKAQAKAEEEPVAKSTAEG